MNIREYIKENILVLDGGMGTLLQAAGIPAGEKSEISNILRSELVTDIHRRYYDAGSNVVNTNTFGANIFHYTKEELEKIIPAAVECAKNAIKLSTGRQEKYIALDIGPLGKMLKPFGTLDFEDAVSAFAETVKIGCRCGVDLVCIETLNDSYETKAALLAVKENCDLPVFVTNAYGQDGKLMTGADACTMVAMLEGMGADAIGVNCSQGPDALAPVVRDYLKYSSIPIIMKPNAGLPKEIDGKTVFDVTPEDFTSSVAQLVGEGVGIVGGCCGTTPEYIERLAQAVKAVKPVEIKKKSYTIATSYSRAIDFDIKPVLIGERINPTGKKLLREALQSGNHEYILDEALKQESAGADMLDVNAGVPGVDESSVLEELICKLQAVTPLPLQIDSANPSSMENAMRRYNGKPMINSVNGKSESMQKIFPLMKKYGGVAVALTLDEEGIPECVEGRVAIAEKIIKTAEQYGIDRKNLVFDTLTMSVGADKNAANTTLEALKQITQKFGVNTVLGVSNISFGLPNRDLLNSVFFGMALDRGLSAAIMNPFSAEMMNTYRSHLLLKGYDGASQAYISSVSVKTEEKTTEKVEMSDFERLADAIIHGRVESAGKLAGEMLKTQPSMDVINKSIIPALDSVGKDYGEGKSYLPQLLMSADAANSAFEQIKAVQSDGIKVLKCDFVIATVKGDIHDIGKNIVKLLLESYGFNVHDLGRDVPAEAVVAEVEKCHSPLVGLSALMTTTVPAMRDTVKLLRERTPWCKIVVGGAVLTEDYAMEIGADKYAADAMETVRYADSVYNSFR